MISQPPIDTYEPLHARGTATPDPVEAPLTTPGAPAGSDRAEPEPGLLTRVLVVDDHPAVRAAVADLLGQERQMKLIAAVASGEEAMRAAGSRPVDVAIVDYQLKGENGLDLARRLLRLPRAPRVLLYTAYADARMAVATRLAGAQGLLGKDSFGDELCHAVRMLASGREHFPDLQSPSVSEALTALDDDERMVAGMIVMGIEPETIADTLGVGLGEITARRRAAISALQGPPRRAGGQPAGRPRGRERHCGGL